MDSYGIISNMIMGTKWQKRSHFGEKKQDAVHSSMPSSLIKQKKTISISGKRYIKKYDLGIVFVRKLPASLW